MLLATIVGAAADPGPFTGDRWTLITEPSGEFLREALGRAALFGLLVIVAALLAWFSGRWAARSTVAVIVTELFTLAPFSIYARRADPVRNTGLDDVRRQLHSETRPPPSFCPRRQVVLNTAGALGLQDIRTLDALLGMWIDTGGT